METETVNGTESDQTTTSESDSLLQDILKEDVIKVLKPGDIVEGALISRGTAVVFVDLGSHGTGIIYGREFFLAHELLKPKDIGATVSAKVIDPENDDGYVELSVSAAYQEIAWKKLLEAFHNKETLTVVVDAANRGGLMATIESIKAFLPVSQLSSEHYPRVEGGDKEKIFEALKAFEGQMLEVQIINADQKSDKLILSEKAVEEDKLRLELANYQIGDTLEGVISGVVDFGLFIKFGPQQKLEGLAHISELSWESIENIRERYHVSDTVKVKLIDLQGEKVSLSLKALEPDPWKTLDENTHAIGKVVLGTPVRFTSFGTFIEVTRGVTGIIRVSEFGSETSMKEALGIGKAVTFTIASLNTSEHRMELKLGEVNVQPTTDNPSLDKAPPFAKASEGRRGKQPTTNDDQSGGQPTTVETDGMTQGAQDKAAVGTSPAEQETSKAAAKAAETSETAQPLDETDSASAPSDDSAESDSASAQKEAASQPTTDDSRPTTAAATSETDGAEQATDEGEKADGKIEESSTPDSEAEGQAKKTE